MNIENLKKVRADIAAAKPEECDMREWDCGTACCIAGFAARHIGWSLRADHVDTGPVRKFLELTSREASRLFYDYPTHYGDSGPMPPPEGWQAWMVQRLTKIIETGEV